MEKQVKQLDDKVKVLEAQLLQQVNELRRLTQELRELRKFISEDRIT